MKLSRNALGPTYIVVVCLCVMCISTWSSTAQNNAKSALQPMQESGQGQKATLYKYVGKESNFAQEPVEIVDIKVRGKETKLNSKIYGEDEDWLSGLTFKVKNKSSKTISSISLLLTFPETKATGNMMVLPLSLGGDPKLAGKGPEPISWKPNEKVEFSLSSERYSKLKGIIETRTSINNINRVIIEPQLIIFDDDTAWSMGEELHRDPSKPTRWVGKD